MLYILWGPRILFKRPHFSKREPKALCSFLTASFNAVISPAFPLIRNSSPLAQWGLFLFILINSFPISTSLFSHSLLDAHFYLSEPSFKISSNSYPLYSPSDHAGSLFYCWYLQDPGYSQEITTFSLVEKQRPAYVRTKVRIEDLLASSKLGFP